MYDETAPNPLMTTIDPNVDLWAVVWPRCFARIKPWHQPPHWSRRDWHEEARGIAALAACESRPNFDPTRGVPETAFLFGRMVAAVTKRYRQEWSYARHTSPSDDLTYHASPTPTSPVEGHEQKLKLEKFLASLEPSEEYLIHQLFWEEVSQDDLATSLGITYRGFTYRKTKLIDKLKRLFPVFYEFDSDFVS